MPQFPQLNLGLFSGSYTNVSLDLCARDKKDIEFLQLFFVQQTRKDGIFIISISGNISVLLSWFTRDRLNRAFQCSKALFFPKEQDTAAFG